MEEYKIRAHHGMCFAYFNGEGYSDAFTENMQSIKERLERDPEVIVICGTDDVCAKCPNNQNRECVSSSKVSGYDSKTLALCGLAAGTRIKWKDFSELVKSRILDAGKRETICGDCEWSGLCK